MRPNFIPRDEAARELAVSTRVLFRYEQRGLVRAVRSEGLEGYGPIEVRTLQTIVAYQRDLGINLAGVEAVLKLRRHLREVHQRLGTLAEQMREALDDRDAEDTGPQG